MMTASRKMFEDRGLTVVPDNDDQEDSGVFVSRSPLAVDVAIGEVRMGVPGEPAPVYATPFVRTGRERTRYTRDYCLGVRFATGVIPTESWESEMTEDGVPAFVIERCHAYLADYAI
jgi:hypothetical protein